MYIAVILENYSQAVEDIVVGITDEDYDIFYEVWAEFGPEGLQYIDYGSLSELVDLLEPPLQVARPNKYKLIGMDLPIGRWTDPQTGEVHEDQVFYLDILQALTEKLVLRRDYEETEETEVRIAGETKP